MTTINTLRFGVLDCAEKDSLNFSKGLLGFPTENRFILLREGIQAPFMWLDPWLVLTDYHFEINEDLKNRLSVLNVEQVMVLGIVVIPEDPEKATINLLAPLVMNIKERLGEQIILEDDSYNLRYPIFQK